MKRIILFLLIVICVFPAWAVLGAEELKAVNKMSMEELREVAGISPSSYWYRFDLAMEELHRLYSKIWGAEASIQYLKENLRERQAEIRLSNIEPPSPSDNKTGYTDAWDDTADIRAAITNAITKERDRLKALHKEDVEAVRQADRAYLANLRIYEVGNGKFEDLYYDSDEWEQAYLETRTVFEGVKARIRKELAEASQQEDTAKMEALLDHLRQAREQFAFISMYHDRYRMAVELETERISQDFDSVENAQAVIRDTEDAKNRLAEKVNFLRATGIAERQLNAIDLAPLDRIIAKAQKYVEQNQNRMAVIPLPDMDLEGLKQQAQKSAKDIDNKLEKLATANDEKQKTKAEKTAEAKVMAEKKQALVQPTQATQLPSLGVPTGTAVQPLVFAPTQTNFTARVGEKFSHSFCQPAASNVNGLCTAAATDPENGLPPYNFMLQTGAGFPPFGIILNNNGLLAGTPTAEGQRSFGVCAVDQGGFNVCRSVTVNVQPALPASFPEWKQGPCYSEEDRCISSCASYPEETRSDCNNYCGEKSESCFAACYTQSKKCWADCCAIGCSGTSDDCSSTCQGEWYGHIPYQNQNAWYQCTNACVTQKGECQGGF